MYYNIMKRVHAGEFVDDLTAKPGKGMSVELSTGGMPGVFVEGGSIWYQHSGEDGMWNHHKGLACRVARLLDLPFPMWAARGSCDLIRELEPYQAELGSTKGFKAMHYNDRLKLAIGWLGLTQFEWEEPGLYTPQRFAQWGTGASFYIRLQSGGRDFRTGKDLPTELRQLGTTKLVSRKMWDINSSVILEEMGYYGSIDSGHKSLPPKNEELTGRVREELEMYMVKGRGMIGAQENLRALAKDITFAHRMGDSVQESRRYASPTGRSLEPPEMQHLPPKEEHAASEKQALIKILTDNSVKEPEAERCKLLMS
jgi:hypothetical protein